MKEDSFALVHRTPSSLEKAGAGAKRIQSAIVADTLALAQARIQTQSLSALQTYASTDLESWFEQGERHYYGRGVPKDYEEAAKCFRMAA